MVWTSIVEVLKMDFLTVFTLISSKNVLWMHILICYCFSWLSILIWYDILCAFLVSFAFLQVFQRKTIENVNPSSIWQTQRKLLSVGPKRSHKNGRTINVREHMHSSSSTVRSVLAFVSKLCSQCHTNNCAIFATLNTRKTICCVQESEGEWRRKEKREEKFRSTLHNPTYSSSRTHIIHTYMLIFFEAQWFFYKFAKEAESEGVKVERITFSLLKISVHECLYVKKEEGEKSEFIQKWSSGRTLIDCLNMRKMKLNRLNIFVCCNHGHFLN